MYLLISEVTLIAREHYRPQPDDMPVYEREYNGQRVLTHAVENSRHMSPPVRYGMLYVDVSDRICIVPDAWSDADAQIARDARWPEVT